MEAINKMALRGTVGKELRWGKTPRGVLAARLFVATPAQELEERGGRPVRTTEWNMAVVEGHLAEQVRNLAKGDEVYVEGRLKTRRWRDTGGIERFCTEIMAQVILVYPKVTFKQPHIADKELQAWVAQYDEAAAREAVEAAGLAQARSRAFS